MTTPNFPTRLWRRILLIMALLLPLIPVATKVEAARHKIIVTTDIGGDPDDMQAMRRMLLYADNLDIIGLIATASGTPQDGISPATRPDLINEIIDDYEDVYSNLSGYSAAYPTPTHLRTLVKSGNPNRGLSYIGAGHDTAGSNFIISQVDAANGPVGISIWGGATDTAQALWRVRQDRSQAAEDAFVAKLIVYSIADQDSTNGSPSTADWLRVNFPALKVLLAGPVSLGSGYKALFRGMYQNDSAGGGDSTIQLVETANVSLNQLTWVNANIRQNHGPLGTNYPVVTQNPTTTRNTSGVKEGDTPSWFYFLDNGLGNPGEPTWGGWGGRFQLVSNQYFTDGLDTHWSGNSNASLRRKWTVARWRKAYQHDFAARMDRCNGPGANLPPVAVLNGDNTRNILNAQADGGATVALSAAGSSDPNGGQTLSYKWWVYHEAGTYPGTVTISNSTSANASFVMPADAAGQEIHVILEVTDNGSPSLTSYRRLVVSGQTLAAAWKLDEASGTSALDSSGNNNTGTLYNGPARISGVEGGALQFDGVNDYVQVPNSASLNQTRDFTFTAWIGPSTVTSANYRTIIAKVTDTSNKQYQLGLGTTGALQFDYEKSGNNYALSGGTVQAGVWQLAAVTVDASRNVALYLDGVLVASGVAPAEVSATSNPVVIGRSGGSYNSLYFAGSLDEITLYGRALSAGEIADLVQGQGDAFQETGGQVLMEAEDFHAEDQRSDPNGLPWISSSYNPGYTGDGYVTTNLPGGANTNGEWSNAAELSYEIDFTTAGSYRVWVRRYAAGAGDNSVFGGVDGTALSGVDNVGSFYGSWAWVQLGTVSITPGRHTFQLRRREAQYRVDRILLTTSSSTPSALGITMGPDEEGESQLWASLAAFQERYFASMPELTGADRGPAGDPDHDGVPNLIEYAQFGHPLLAAPALPSSMPHPLILRYYRSKVATDHQCTAQVSGNLTDWVSGPDHVHETVLGEDVIRELIEARDLGSSTGTGSRYMRLQVAMLP